MHRHYTSEELNEIRDAFNGRFIVDTHSLYGVEVIDQLTFALVKTGGCYNVQQVKGCIRDFIKKHRAIEKYESTRFNQKTLIF